MNAEIGTKTKPSTAEGDEPDPASPGALHFADFDVDLERGELRVRGAVIALRPKSFALLVYLARHPGRLLSKDELIGAVWPDVAVTDDSLVQCISELRAALGDGDQHLIKTVPRRGYLLEASPLDAPFAFEAADGGEDPGRPRGSSPPEPMRRQSWPWLLAFVQVFAAQELECHTVRLLRAFPRTRSTNDRSAAEDFRIHLSRDLLRHREDHFQFIYLRQFTFDDEVHTGLADILNGSFQPRLA